MASAAETKDTPPTTPWAVDVKSLNFRFNHTTPYVFRDLDFRVPHGARCLVVGDNGAGKTSLLRVIGGKHMHPEGAVTVLGKSSFHDTSLNSERAYLGSDWGRRTVAFSGYSLPIQADIAAVDMMKSEQELFPARRDMLMELLQIDPSWRMHQISDGQRRRVQIFLQLLRPYKLVMLDEITTELDVITRADFLQHLKQDSERNGTTVLYATHIFSGLDDWWTHIAFIANGAMQLCCAREDVGDYKALLAAGVHSPLNRLVEDWIRAARRGAVITAAGASAPAAVAAGGEGGAGGGTAAAAAAGVAGPEAVEVEMKE